MALESSHFVRDILLLVGPLVADLRKNFTELDSPETFDISDTKINCVSILSELVSLFQELAEAIEKNADWGTQRHGNLKEQIDVSLAEIHLFATEIISPKPMTIRNGFSRIGKLDNALVNIAAIAKEAEDESVRAPGDSSMSVASEEATAAPVPEEIVPETGPDLPSREKSLSGRDLPAPPETPVDLLKVIEAPEGKPEAPREMDEIGGEEKEPKPVAEPPKPPERPTASLIFQGIEKLGGAPDLEAPKPEDPKPAAEEPKNEYPPVPESVVEPMSEASKEWVPEMTKKKDLPEKIVPEPVLEPHVEVPPIEVLPTLPPHVLEPPQKVPEPPIDQFPYTPVELPVPVPAPLDGKWINQDIEQLKLLNDELINKVRALEQQIEKVSGQKDQMAKVLESRLQRRIDFFEEKIQQTKNELAVEIEKKGLVIEKKLSAIVERQEEKIMIHARAVQDIRPDIEPVQREGAAAEVERLESDEEPEPPVQTAGPSVVLQAIKVFLIALAVITTLAFGSFYLLTRSQPVAVSSKGSKGATQTYEILATPAFDRMTKTVPASLDKRYLRLLVIQLKSNPDPKVRANMARRLAKWAWKNVPEMLLETGMRDTSTEVVRAAFETFKTLTGFPNPEDLSYAAAENWWLVNKGAVDAKLTDEE